MSNEKISNPTVLIIEDDAFIQAILSQTLSEDFVVTTFSDGLEGLNYLQSGNIPDIILSDLNIPGIDGMNLLQQVRNSGFFSSVPFIFLSGKQAYFASFFSYK